MFTTAMNSRRAYQEWYGDLISGVVGRLELAALPNADSILAASEAIFRHLRRISKVPATVFYTCPDIDEIPEISRPAAKVKLGFVGLFIILFCGKVRQDYDIDMILNAARDLKGNDRSRFKFVFVGPPDTMSWVASRVAKERVESLFVFKGYVPYRELLLCYLASDLCFAVTRNLGLNTQTLIPIKLFEAMACGVPIVVRGGTAVAEIVQKWGCGMVVEEASDFSRELIRISDKKPLLKALGESSRAAFVGEYNLGEMGARLIGVYEAMLSVVGTRSGIPKVRSS